MTSALPVWSPGLPLLMTALWAAVTAVYHQTQCWWGYSFTPYYWVLEGPRFTVIAVSYRRPGALWAGCSVGRVQCGLIVWLRANRHIQETCSANPNSSAACSKRPGAVMSRATPGD